MEKNEVNLLKICILPLLYAFIATTCFVHCDATKIIRSGKHTRSSNMKPARKFHQLRRLDTSMPLDSSNTDPYVSSPFSLPPYNSLPPFPFPENTPPFCVYPPFTPQTPTIPSPIQGYTPSPPPTSSAPTLPGPNPILPPSPPQSSPIPNPPIIIPSPTSVVPNPPTVPVPTQPVLSPPYFEPGPPSYGPSPPSYEPSPPSYEPSPPSYEPGPPYNIPSPFGFVPRSPTIFLPPIVFPPPAVPPPPHKGSTTAMWCVAKASVPEPIIEEAMNYACGSGADCDQIQPSGSCFQPNTLFAHASYAFNSYWQRTKVAGGTCDFGGTALLVTVDPSYDGCHFLYF